MGLAVDCYIKLCRDAVFGSGEDFIGYKKLTSAAREVLTKTLDDDLVLKLQPEPEWFLKYLGVVISWRLNFYC